MGSLDPDYQTRASIFIGLKTQSAESRELAWTEFHRRYAPIIRGFARKLGAPAAHLDDIVQDIMIGFYSAAPNYVYDPAKGRFRGYLKKCVVSAIGKLRKRLPPAGNLEAIDPASPDAEKVWDRIWEKELLHAAMREARSHCSDVNFRAFELYAIQKQPIEQVCKDLKITADQVYQTKARMKVVMEDLLRRLEDEYG